MEIKLVRHAQSSANVGEVDANIVGDHKVPLTIAGHKESHVLGTDIGPFLNNALIYCSPYLRTRQTLTGIIGGAISCVAEPGDYGLLNRYEDPRLREVEWGLGLPSGQEQWDRIEEMKEEYGSFYVRRTNGESCADCFDRCSSFIESMWRQINRKNSTKVLIVSHGLTIRCFVMRFLHLTVEQFEKIRNPKNCEVITISNAAIDAQYYSGGWGVKGLRLIEEL